MDVPEQVADQLPIRGKIGGFEYRTCDPVMGENRPLTAVVWRRTEGSPWQLPSPAGIDFVNSVISHSSMHAASGMEFATDARQLGIVFKRLQEGQRSR